MVLSGGGGDLVVIFVWFFRFIRQFRALSFVMGKRNKVQST